MPCLGKVQDVVDTLLSLPDQSQQSATSQPKSLGSFLSTGQQGHVVRWGRLPSKEDPAPAYSIGPSPGP